MWKQSLRKTKYEGTSASFAFINSMKSLFKTLKLIRLGSEKVANLSLIDISLKRSFRSKSICEDSLIGFVTAELRITEITGSAPMSVEFLFLINDADRFFDEK